MGAMPGFQQVSLYVDPELYYLAGHVAEDTRRPIYQFVNDAIRREIERCTTPAQRKAYAINLKRWRETKRAANHQGREGKRNGVGRARRDSRL